ncbi:hypothetical protein CN984_12625 [Bacillus cereus]|uniref:Uncharacterized protein n=1 Tax=Bacillus cereus TaxID=1396 RepID=A0A2A7FNQ6_BACCE|nr:helix-turn-helix transcriptional regulator [Bacillus cereus]PEA25896.1 hypothetical protein CON44_18330 [Bacillus cereus]PGO29262.1 hypothetical protein CN984_12625 [Bacillus cereus]
MNGIGERIREARKVMNLTQPVLAEKINETAQVVSNWEREYTCPSIEDVYKLSVALNRTTDYFIIGEENKGVESEIGCCEAKTIEVSTKLTGERIKKLRKSRGWGLEELAKRVNRAKTTMSEIENNKKNAGRKLIEALSAEFEVSTDYLLGISDGESFVYKVEGSQVSVDMSNLKEKKILTDIEFSMLETLLKGIENRLK